LPVAHALLEDLVRGLPDDRDTVIRLAEVAARSGDEARAIELYVDLAATGPHVARAKALLALAELKRRRPDKWPADEADALIERAFDLAIADSSVIDLLEERAARDNDFRSFVASAEAAVGRVQPNTAGVLAMRTTLARVLRERLRNHDAADRHLSAAIIAFPESMATRLALASALRGRNGDAAVAELRRAVESDPLSPQPFEALAALLVASSRPETANMLRSAALLLRRAEDDADAPVVSVSSLHAIPDSLLAEETLARFVGPPRTWFLRRVLSILEPFLPKIFAGTETQLETRSKLPESYPIVTEVRSIAAALGVTSPLVCRGGGRETTLLLTEPRTLVLGSDLLGEGTHSVALFCAAYACSRIAGHGSLYAMPREQVAALLDAAAVPETDGSAIRELRRRVSSVLPRKSRKELERVVAEGGGDVRSELPIWDVEEARRATLTGVILCRDLRAVGQVLIEGGATLTEDRRRALAANGPLREVLEFVASSACWELFVRVYGRA
jgi:hypothetical protein